jgi:hypothetical protein
MGACGLVFNNQACNVMICPKCNTNSISFLKAWFKSGLGRYRCPNCGANCRVRKNGWLTVGSTCLGLAAAGAAIYYQSWKVLIVASVVALILDGVMDSLFRQLELSEPISQRDVGST